MPALARAHKQGSENTDLAVEGVLMADRRRADG
jgi:hypothetical protein